MPMGLEGWHTWTSPSGLVIVLGKTDDGTAALVPIYPCYSVRRIGGLASLAEVEDLRDPLIAEDGEVPYPSALRGRTVTYEGMIRARSAAVLRQAEEALRVAFSELDAEGQVLISAHPQAASPPASLYYSARALSVEVDDEAGQPHNPTLGWQRAYAVALRQSDPRFYAP
jgi:hypothetical protein